MLRKLPLPFIAVLILAGVMLTFIGMGIHAFGGTPANGNFAILWGATLVLGAIGLLQADMRAPSRPSRDVLLLALRGHRGAEQRHMVLVAHQTANTSDIHVERPDIPGIAHAPVDALRVRRYQLAVPSQ